MCERDTSVNMISASPNASDGWFFVYPVTVVCFVVYYSTLWHSWLGMFFQLCILHSTQSLGSEPWERLEASTPTALQGHRATASQWSALEIR